MDLCELKARLEYRASSRTGSKSYRKTLPRGERGTPTIIIKKLIAEYSQYRRYSQADQTKDDEKEKDWVRRHQPGSDLGMPN